MCISPTPGSLPSSAITSIRTGRGVLYDRCDPATAHRLAQRWQGVYTPQHASWLHSAEFENSMLARQCLQRRIPEAETLAQETTAWYQRRNADPAPVRWRFTTAEARIKLRRLYPAA